MQTDKQAGKAKSEPASMTGSMLWSLVYLATICWVVPFAPMIVVWLLDWSFTAFLVLWVDGLPLFFLAWYYFFKKKSEQLTP